MDWLTHLKAKRFWQREGHSLLSDELAECQRGHVLGALRESRLVHDRLAEMLRRTPEHMRSSMVLCFAAAAEFNDPELALLHVINWLTTVEVVPMKQVA